MEENKILPIIGYGSKMLREVCIEAENTPEIKTLANDMLFTMKSIGTAVGLASPQLNVNSRVFVMKMGNKEIVVVNPIIKKQRGIQKSHEGCLSIAGVYEDVFVRNEIIDVEFYDIDFNKQKLRLRGFDAVVFSHEIDHLNGILFTDLLTAEGKERVADKLSDITKGIYIASHTVVFPDVLPS
ncbi:MAG TPA: peptide deformylase [Ignavibacteriaceae bacterium]